MLVNGWVWFESQTVDDGWKGSLGAHNWGYACIGLSNSSPMHKHVIFGSVEIEVTSFHSHGSWPKIARTDQASLPEMEALHGQKTVF